MLSLKIHCIMQGKSYLLGIAMAIKLMVHRLSW